MPTRLQSGPNCISDEAQKMIIEERWQLFFYKTGMMIAVSIFYWGNFVV